MASKFQCRGMMKGFLLLITFPRRQAERRGTLGHVDTGRPGYLHLWRFWPLEPPGPSLPGPRQERQSLEEPGGGFYGPGQE